MIFRLSQKLAKKIRVKQLQPSQPLASNPYTDWSASLFTANRSQYIILTNTPSLYVCIIPGRGVSNHGAFVKQSLEAIRWALEDHDLHETYHRDIIPSAKSIEFAKALDRSTTGSMTEQIKYAQCVFEEDSLEPHRVARKLNKHHILSQTDYEIPTEYFRSMAGDIQEDPVIEEIRTIRAAIHEETKGITNEERVRRHSSQAEEAMSEFQVSKEGK